VHQRLLANGEEEQLSPQPTPIGALGASIRLPRKNLTNPALDGLNQNHILIKSAKV